MLWLMPQLLEEKPNAFFFQYDGAPPYIHSEMKTFWNRQFSGQQFSWGIHFLAFIISRFDPFDFILWGFLKDEACVPPVPVTLNN